MIRVKLSRRRRGVLLASSFGALVLAGLGLLALNRPAPARYRPDQPVEGITADLRREVPEDHPRVTFTEVSESAGLAFTHFSGERSTQLPEDMGSGAAFGDYDGDGDDDLFVVNFAGPLTLDEKQVEASPARSRLFRNDGRGGFTDVTAAAGLDFHARGMGAAWGDADGDGDLDLAVSAFPRLFLWRNRGDGTFEDATAGAGLARFEGFWTGVSWGDYDRDGDLDLYVCGYVQYRFDPADWDKASTQFQAEVPFTLNPSSYRPERNLLFRNGGAGVFREVAASAGVHNPTGRSLSAAWCDFDGDGWLDLYVANDVSDNAMLRNLGNGRFADVSHAAWVADYRGAMGLGVGDWDGDQDFDIFVTHWVAQENALFTNMSIPFPGASRGKLTFMDVADQYGLGQSSLEYVKWGTSFFDYDNDGRLDLFVANGSTFQDPSDKRRLVPMRHLLYWNRGEPLGYFEVGAVSGDVFRRRTVGRGAAFADYDGDGDVDVVVVNHGGRLWLLRNDGGNRNRWLAVKLRGRGNRSALGAVVKVVAGGRAQLQQVGSQPSYLSQNSLTAHFGLGRLAAAEAVVVEFPGGRRVERQGVEAGRVLVVDEP